MQGALISNASRYDCPTRCKQLIQISPALGTANTKPFEGHKRFQRLAVNE